MCGKNRKSAEICGNVRQGTAERLAIKKLAGNHRSARFWQSHPISLSLKRLNRVSKERTSPIWVYPVHIGFYFNLGAFYRR
jgi:hypothetical protein